MLNVSELGHLLVSFYHKTLAVPYMHENHASLVALHRLNKIGGGLHQPNT